MLSELAASRSLITIFILISEITNDYSFLKLNENESINETIDIAQSSLQSLKRVIDESCLKLDSNSSVGCTELEMWFVNLSVPLSALIFKLNILSCRADNIRRAQLRDIFQCLKKNLAQIQNVGIDKWDFNYSRMIDALGTASTQVSKLYMAGISRRMPHDEEGNYTSKLFVTIQNYAEDG